MRDFFCGCGRTNHVSRITYHALASAGSTSFSSSARATTKNARDTSALLLRSAPRVLIAGVLDVHGLHGGHERKVRVDHDGELGRGLRSDARLVRAGMRPVGNTCRMQRYRARADAAPAREVTAHVEDHLVAVDARMRIRTRDRLRMGIRDARNERAHQEPRPGEGRVGRLIASIRGKRQPVAKLPCPKAAKARQACRLDCF